MNEIRLGKVSSINYREGTADIYFNDEEQTVRKDLPFLSAEYKMPKVNNTVVVIFQSNTAGGKEQGYILGPIFNAENMPEEYGKDVFFKRFSRNSYMKYDPVTDVLEIHANKVIIHNLSQEG